MSPATHDIVFDLKWYTHLTMDKRRFFDAWLEREGLLPMHVTRIELLDEGGRDLELVCHDLRDGAPYLIEGDVVATKTVRVKVNTPFPLQVSGP